MVWHQIVNSVAATVAALIWFRAIGTTMRIAGRAAVVATCAVFGITAWYAALYLALGTGVLDLPLEKTVPLFRWAFPPFVLAAAVRYLAMRPTVHAITDSIDLAQKATKRGDDDCG
jgi:hypothetical protein